jgi:hypothetical protein
LIGEFVAKPSVGVDQLERINQTQGAPAIRRLLDGKCFEAAAICNDKERGSGHDF